MSGDHAAPPPERAIVSAALQHAAAGFRVLPLKGKSPAVAGKNWWERASKEPSVILQMFTAASEADNVGIACGEGFFVLDIDPRNGGDVTLDQLEARHGTLPETVCAATGGGGRHIFLGLPAGAAINNGSGKRLGPGIDIKTRGGQVVAPGSTHPETGKPYEWAQGRAPDQAPLQTAPAWLLELLKPSASEPSQPMKPRRIHGGKISDYARAEKWLAQVPPSVSGQRGDDQLFEAACGLVRGFALSEVDALALLRSDYNPSCRPPWPDDRLRYKVKEASEKSTREFGYLRDADRRPSRPRAPPAPAAEDPETPEEHPSRSDPFFVCANQVTDEAVPFALQALTDELTRVGVRDVTVTECVRWSNEHMCVPPMEEAPLAVMLESAFARAAQARGEMEEGIDVSSPEGRQKLDEARAARDKSGWKLISPIPALRAYVRATFSGFEKDMKTGELEMVLNRTGEQLCVQLGNDARALQSALGFKLGHLLDFTQKAHPKARGAADLHRVLWDIAPDAPEVIHDTDNESQSVRLVRTLLMTTVWQDNIGEDGAVLGRVPTTLFEAGGIHADLGVALYECGDKGDALAINMEKAAGAVLRFHPEFRHLTSRSLIQLLQEAPGYNGLERNRDHGAVFRAARWHRILLRALPSVGDDDDPASVPSVPSVPTPANRADRSVH